MSIELCPFGEQTGAELLISTVPAGARRFLCRNGQFSRARLHLPRIVMDVVYYPWPTPLATAASQAGSVAVSGFELLVHQAARQVELDDRADPAGPAMREAGLAGARPPDRDNQLDIEII